MDYGRAFTFALNDREKLKKLGILGLLVFGWFLIVPFFFVLGYAAKAMRAIALGEDRLPEWEDWGGLFTTGLKVFLIGFIVNIPVLLLTGIGRIFTSTGSFLHLPFSSVLGTPFGSLASLYQLVAGFFEPAMLMLFVATGSLAAPFVLKDVVAIVRGNLVDYVVILVIMVALVIPALILLAIPVLGWFAAPFYVGYLMTVSSHLYGQIIARGAVAQTYAVHA